MYPQPINVQAKALKNRIDPEHLVVLLAGPISHTSTQCIVLSIFYILLDLSTIYFTRFSGC